MKDGSQKCEYGLHTNASESQPVSIPFLGRSYEPQLGLDTDLLVCKWYVSCQDGKHFLPKYDTQ